MTDVAIQKVSRLAKIGLTSEETLCFQKDLQRIINFVSELAEVPTQGVEPLVNPATDWMGIRPDQVTPDATVDEILKNAPSQDQNMFLVPKIVE